MPALLWTMSSRPDLLQDGVVHRGDLVRLGDVGGERDGLAAPGLDATGNVLGAAQVDVGDGHQGALGGE